MNTYYPASSLLIMEDVFVVGKWLCELLPYVCG
jgi:hypothetical protein